MAKEPRFQQSAAMPTVPAAAPAADAQWYKDAVIYQLHVRSFFDSNNDGVGDFVGLARKLDYLQDLGVTAIWLLPFYPSPLRDDGYDIGDYMDVNRAYGTLRDFRHLVREAHSRGLRVITELVINHTSDQHAWFQRARRSAPGSPLRDFYVWSDTPEKYQDARIIFKDFEVSNWAWDPLAKAYYWHRFYSHQPDLNFDNPQVCRAVFDVCDYWLRMGVDGMRLDAVPYLFEREGTNCENLSETHAFLKSLRRHVDQHFPGRMLLAEANQWPEDAIAYFGEGDECHTAFHFPVMPRMFMAMHMEDRFPILDILQQTPPIPESCQWVMFLRNHDELTLEMVTDEERDYMYRAYARDRQARINLGIRRRLAPLLSNNRRQIELMNGLLFSLPGTPVLYYGDEIGMGDNIYLGDRHGVRTPMQWSPDRNAGFSRANPQRLYSPVILDGEYVFDAVNVENQQKNPNSLLWWMKRLIVLRQHYRALGRGSFEPLAPNNPKVLAFIRRFNDECLLIVANLARVAQFVELDLSPFSGRRPVELFGQTPFPQIGTAPYTLTLSPHGFFWFSLKGTAEEEESAVTAPSVPVIEIQREADLLRGRAMAKLEAVLSTDLLRRPWFAGKLRAIQAVHILGTVRLDKGRHRGGTWLSFVRVEYLDGDPEAYLLPVAVAWDDEAQRLLAGRHEALIAQIYERSSAAHGVLCDALLEPSGAALLLEAIRAGRHIKGTNGELIGSAFRTLANMTAEAEAFKPAPGPSGQNSTSVVFGDKLILKVFRHLELGVNPALEVGRLLTDELHFSHTNPVHGAIEYQYRADEEPVTLGILETYYPNATTAWQFTADWLDRFLEHVVTQTSEHRAMGDESASKTLWELATGDAPPLAREYLGGYLESAALLGQRTGEMHLALASSAAPAFVPESFTQLYQRSLEQSTRKLTAQAFQLLRRRVDSLPAETVEVAQEALDRQARVHDVFHSMLKQRIAARRIRCQGNYHLGQVLHTGKDFLIGDFEGDPSQAMAVRRIKRSPLADVASMLRSFRYVMAHVLMRLSQTGMSTPEALAAPQAALRFWCFWSSSAFLKTYAATVSPAGLLPESPAQRESLLHFHLLQRTIQELMSDLNHRPQQAIVPLRGILELT
jgi:maltose alpha-D-glucosyltransferase/alpha-amylase